MNYSNRPMYQRRRRIALLVSVVILLLVVLFVVGLRAGGTGGEQTVQKVNTPTVEQAPEAIDDQMVAEEEVGTVEEETQQ